MSRTSVNKSEIFLFILKYKFYFVIKTSSRSPLQFAFDQKDIKANSFT